MSANFPMSPMQSTTIKALLFVGLSQLVLQLQPMFVAHKFDIWTLGATAIPIVAGILARLGMSDVTAPPALGFLNK